LIAIGCLCIEKRDSGIFRSPIFQGRPQEMYG